MTTIKNKQTGETLTGEITDQSQTDMRMLVGGCSRAIWFLKSEWEILPPPLPTGIGAVVERNDGLVFIRLAANKWRTCADTKTYLHDEVLCCGTITILSHGVQL